MSRPERVQAAFEVWEGKPELGPSATAMFEYITHLEAEIARLTKALTPFLEYIPAGMAAKMPPGMTVTSGSAMARRQLIVADFKALHAALKPDTGEKP